VRDETRGDPAGRGDSRILLVGNPNVGKSVIFSLLTGTYVVVSNYPGTTVEVSRGKLRGLRREAEVVDTPGVNDLTPLSVDEIVTRNMLLEDDPCRVVQVIDARNLERGLTITAELAEMGVPLVVCLNMMDEARRAGMEIDVGALRERLGVEVVPTVAVERRGIPALFRALDAARPAHLDVAYRPEVEAAVHLMEPLLPDGPMSRRSLALMLLCGDPSLYGWIADRVKTDRLEEINRILAEAAARFQRPLSHLIATARRDKIEHLVGQVVRRRIVSASRSREIISAACMHPVFGSVLLLVILYLIYLAVGKFAAGTAVDFLESSVFGDPGGALVAYPSPSSDTRWEVQVPATEQPNGLVLKLPREGRPRPAPRDVGPMVRLARLLPGSEAPRFLREGESYRFHLRLREPEPGVRIHVACELRYIESGASELHLAAVQADGTASGVFAPSTHGAEYSLVVLGPSEAPSGRVQIVEAGVERLPSGYVNPWLAGLIAGQDARPARAGGTGFIYDLLMGEYGLVSIGITYSLALVLPIVAAFFLCFGLLEDSGYLARLTVMANRGFKVIGLNGRAVLPMVLGLGCDTMATLAARILDTKKARLIVTILLALGVPCSAQLGVLLGMLGDIGPAALATCLGVVGAQLVLVGYLANRVLPGEVSDFIVEIPLIRLPRMTNIIIKTYFRVVWFLREALPFFVLGTFALFVLSRLGALRYIQVAAQPLVVHLLGLPEQATPAFLVGFLRRDYGAAGLFDLRLEGLLDNVQTVVAMITITLFVPCVAQFFIIIKEQGLRRALFIVAFIILVAFGTGGVVNFALRSLHVTF